MKRSLSEIRSERSLFIEEHRFKMSKFTDPGEVDFSLSDEEIASAKGSPFEGECSCCPADEDQTTFPDAPEQHMDFLEAWHHRNSNACSSYHPDRFPILMKLEVIEADGILRNESSNEHIHSQSSSSSDDNIAAGTVPEDGCEKGQCSSSNDSQSEPVAESSQDLAENHLDGEDDASAAGSSTAEMDNAIEAGDSDSSSDDEDNHTPDQFQLNENLCMYPHKSLAQRKNVVEGEICADVSLGNRCCVIKFDQDDDRIVNEIRALRKLSSPSHVVCFLDQGSFQDGNISYRYVVLEKCHTLNLESYVLRGNVAPLYDINRGVKFCHQLVSAVKYIHKNLIMHKDLKPSNILLSHDLENVKIADFGSSEEVTSSLSRVLRTCTFGTLGYHPPESLEGNFISLKSDIYSLGVVIYFLLSMGKSPFGTQTALLDHNTLHKVTVIDASQLQVSNPLATKHLIESMLSKDRCCRPSIELVDHHLCWTGFAGCPNIVYAHQPEHDDDDEAVVTEVAEDYDDDNTDELLQALQHPDIVTLLMAGSSPSTTTNAISRVLRSHYPETEPGVVDKLSIAIATAVKKLKVGKYDESVKLVKDSIPSSLSADDVNQMGMVLGEEHPFPAVILRRVAGLIYQQQADLPDEAVKWFSDRISNINCIAGQLIKCNSSDESTGVVIKGCLHFIDKLLCDLRAVKHAKKDLQMQLDIGCLLCVSRISLDATKYLNVPPDRRILSRCKEELSRFKEQFGVNATNQKHYRYLLNNIGESYMRLNQLDEAERYLKRALTAKQASTYRSYDERSRDIQLTRDNLNELRQLRDNRIQ